MASTTHPGIERRPGIAADTMVLTARDGLVQIGDLAEGLGEGQMRRLSLAVAGDDAEEEAVAVVALGERSAYRVTLENGLTWVSTYASGTVTARNRHSAHHLRSTEDLVAGDTVVVPRGRHRLGRYDGRSWSSAMLDRGAYPPEVLRGSREWLRKVIRTTLLEPYGQMGEGIRSTLEAGDDNELTLSWRAPSKWLGRQVQAILIPFADCLASFDDATLVMTVTGGDLVRLDAATDIVDGIYDEGECDVDRQVAGWLMSLDDGHVRAREVVPVSTVEGVNRRAMYALVLAAREGTFVANGTLHDGLRGPGALSWEEA